MKYITRTDLTVRTWNKNPSLVTSATIPANTILDNVLREPDEKFVLFESSAGAFTAQADAFDKASFFLSDEPTGVADYSLDPDPVRWVDRRLIPGVSLDHWNRIKAKILEAHAAYLALREQPARMVDGMRLPHHDLLVHVPPMRQAFDGIAQVLFEIEILTPELLEVEIPKMVWEAAIAGQWWERGSEYQMEEYPEQFGNIWLPPFHHKSWQSSLFVGEAAKWRARLLERSARSSPIEPPEGLHRTSTRKRRPRREPDPRLVELRERVCKMYDEHFSQRKICFSLKGTPRPPNVKWHESDWPVAYSNPKYKRSVQKWLSVNGKRRSK